MAMVLVFRVMGFHLGVRKSGKRAAPATVEGEVKRKGWAWPQEPLGPGSNLGVLPRVLSQLQHSGHGGLHPPLWPRGLTRRKVRERRAELGGGRKLIKTLQLQ